MFEGFAKVWTPVCMATELPNDRPLAVRVAGTPLVLFRGPRTEGNAAPVAMVDRCPHRGVALSLGQVRDGCLACPFHGWRFDHRGQVCHVPWNPDAKTEQLRGLTVPARELGGQIWIYTSIGTEPEQEPSIAEEFLRSDVRVSGGVLTWDSHWTRAMENMLDWPHLPFVHRGTIGKGMLARPDSRMDIRIEERPWGAHSTIAIDGKEQPGALDLRWPNRMNLIIPAPGKTLVMQVACVPIDAHKTLMLLTTARSFLRTRLFDSIFHRMNLRIAKEDKAIVESSFPVEVPPAGDERSVRTDALPLLFRKRFFRELRESGTSPGGARANQGLPVLTERDPKA